MIVDLAWAVTAVKVFSIRALPQISVALKKGFLSVKSSQLLEALWVEIKTKRLKIRPTNYHKINNNSIRSSTRLTNS